VPSFIPNTGVPLEHSQALLTKYASQFNWNTLNYAAHLKARGINLTALPTYYMGSDSLKQWNLIYTFIHAVFLGYYQTDAAVVADPYVADWVNEIVTYGKLKGFPTSITTIAGLATEVTQFIFLATTQHTGINYNQEQFFSNMRSAPNVLFGTLPDKSKVTLDFIEAGYPSRTQTIFLYVVVAFLSSQKGEGNIIADDFGLYSPTLLTESYAETARNNFFTSLTSLTATITARPKSGLGFKFNILAPAVVADSIRK